MGTTAYLYVFDTLADWEIAYLTAELHTKRFFRKGAPDYTVKTVGLDKEPVTTMGGLRVLPDCRIEDCTAGDAGALILPGGNTWAEPVHLPVLAKAGEFLESGIVVGAICGATAGLARAGLLNTRYHTSNDPGFLKSAGPAYTGEQLYRNEPAVTDGNLVTAPGHTPLEFTCHLLRALDVFSPSTLDAWYSLYRTGKPEYYYALVRSVADPVPDPGT